VFTEKQITGRHDPLKIRFPDVVHVNATAFEVFARLTLRRAQAGEHQRLDQRQADIFPRAHINFLGRNFADDFVEGGFGNAVEVAAKKNFTGANGLGCRLDAVNQIRRRLRQRLVRLACAGICGVLCFQRGDFFACEEGEIFQVADDVAVVGVDPELVELVNACALRVEPDGARGRLAEFGAIRVRDEREREAEDVFAEFLAREVNAGGDVAPLVAAADLDLKFGVAAEHL
jgi:hypothetical protein